jgi:hypothetical protein
MMLTRSDASRSGNSHSWLSLMGASAALAASAIASSSSAIRQLVVDKLAGSYASVANGLALAPVLKPAKQNGTSFADPIGASSQVDCTQRPKTRLRPTNTPKTSIRCLQRGSHPDRTLKHRSEPIGPAEAAASLDLNCVHGWSGVRACSHFGKSSYGSSFACAS